MTAPIEVQDVGFAYRRAQPVLQNISFTVAAGTFLAVVGPNGAGKSTLIALVAGLLAPQTGEVLLGGRDIRTYGHKELAGKIALVRQEYAPVFGFSVSETVLMARTAHYGPLGFESKADREHVMKALEMTETAEFASRPLASLSGGERQRVFIARALAQDTPILLMDEPTSFLDLRRQVGIYDLLKTIQLEGHRTIVAITQDINLAAQYCDQTLLLCPLRTVPATGKTDIAGMGRSQFRIGPTQEVLTAAHLEDVFGVGVASCRIGKACFFAPLGRMANDTGSATNPMAAGTPPGESI
jgi:iron complex transport system ATP-binding protein